MASQCESVAETGYRSSGLTFSLFALAQQCPPGCDRICSFHIWTHSPQSRSHCFSVHLQYYWLLHHDHNEKEGPWQPDMPVSRQAWHKPSSPNFSAIDFAPGCTSCRPSTGPHSPAPGAALWFPCLLSCPQYLRSFAEQQRPGSREDTAACSPPTPHKS